MEKRRVITIDNGGSELRMIVNSDNKKVQTMEKEISIITKEEFRPKDNVGEFDIIDLKSGNKDFNNIYAMGDGYYMYGGVDIGMTNQQQKTLTVAWYQQVLCAVAKDAIMVANNAGKVEAEDGAVNDFTVDYVITTLIPVHEHLGATDYVTTLKENLAGTYTVIFPMCEREVKEVTFTIKKEHIGVLPEGVVALSSLRGILNKNDYTLIIDMGHVTSDISLCKGTTPIGNAVKSSNFAGGTLLKLVSNIYANKGVVVNDSMTVDTLTTGKLKIGARSIDVSNEVSEAKHQFVTNYMKDVILSVIDLAGISASSIQYVVPIGAVLGTKNPSTGKYDIMEDLVNECGLSNAEVKLVSDDLRYVNVEKAAEYCDIFAKRV